MTARDPSEQHRVASPLELFFDLVFVVAVSFASQYLHHLERDGEIFAGVTTYLLVFFAIWWAWMNFTWFGTSFDTDDWLYRVLTIVQMLGVLVLASGIPSAMVESNFALVTYGYVIMRLAMVTQWIRAAVGSPTLRRTATVYAAGISIVQILWVLRLQLPAELGYVSFVILAFAEISVPILAQRHTATPAHPHHVTERYGLFTLILLGESLLASTSAIVDTLRSSEHIEMLMLLSVCGLLLVAGMWWMYFARPQHGRITTTRSSFVIGYVHYAIFAAAGAVSSGFEVAIDLEAGGTDLDYRAVSALTAIPVAIFMLGVWFVAIRPVCHRWASIWTVTAALGVALSSLVPISLVIPVALLASVIVVLELDGRVPRALAQQVQPHYSAIPD